MTYKSWLNVEGVDQEMLTSLLEDISNIYRELMLAERFGQSLKEDRFLSAIRQRFNLQVAHVALTYPRCLLAASPYR